MIFFVSFCFLSLRCGLSQRSGIPTSAQSQVQFVWTFSKTSGEWMCASIPCILSPSYSHHEILLQLCKTVLNYRPEAQYSLTQYIPLTNSFNSYNIANDSSMCCSVLPESISRPSFLSCTKHWPVCPFRAAAMTLRTVLLSLQALLAAAEPDDPQDAVVANQVGVNVYLFWLFVDWFVVNTYF